MRTWIACLTLVLVAFATAQDGPDFFVIDRMHVDVNIQESGRIDVIETIDVTFRQSRRGIFRFIATDYDTGTGFERSIFLTGVRVTDGEGEPLTTHVNRDRGDISIRVGDEDIFLPAGTQMRYVIRYRVRNVLNWIQDDDFYPGERVPEFYWNVTGDRWPTTIGRTEFTVTYPEQAADDMIRARVFAGRFGDDTSDTATERGNTPAGLTGVALDIDDDRTTGVRTEPLQEYEGVTVSIQLPPNSIPEPTWLQRAWDLISANLALTAPIFSIGLMFALFLKKGRDERPSELKVRFEPPDELSGAEAGTLLDERVDQRDIAAGIMTLAVKGYLAIEPYETGLVFKKRTAALIVQPEPKGQELTDFQNSLLSRIKRGGTRVTESDLQKHVGPEMATLRKSLYDAMVRRGYYKASPEQTRILWGLLGVVISVAAAMILQGISQTTSAAPFLIGLILGVVGCSVIAKHMPKKTVLGARVTDQLRGFEHFMLGRASYNEWVAETKPDGVMFEQYLPYAVAFGTIDSWTQRFSDIVTEPPSWYRTTHTTGMAWSMSSFASDLNIATTSLARAASVPPRSSGASGGGSGFSSGGFSGGGFGGGGGGSW